LQTDSTDAGFLERTVEAADQYVDAMLMTHDGGAAALAHRTAMSQLLSLIAVYTTPDSRFHASAGLPGPMTSYLERLEVLQGPTGLFDGDNLCSPPDSAFSINDACLALQLIRSAEACAEAGGETADADAEAGTAAAGLAGVGRRIRNVIAAATPAMVAGGVHTPNHRWELSAALAQIHRLEPRPEIDQRVNEWLAEGIDQLPDGMYSERSPLYATAVTNPSLLAIADCSDRPWLLDHVRRNLEAFLPWFNPDGTVESLFSRRQDQWLEFDGSVFMLLYRRFAIQDQRPDFGAAASWLERFPSAEPAKLLARTRTSPLLRERMPVGDTDSALRPAIAQLGSCGLYRFRSGNTAVTVFGGGDHTPSGVASGLSNNPTFLRFQHGNSLLSDVRLSRSFFDLGPFRSMATAAAGTSVRLAEEIGAKFYLPLPAEKRQDGGMYGMAHEGRFSSAMDFASRPAVNHRLATAMDVKTEGSRTELTVGFDGADTSFALELTFRPGGVLTGVEPLGDSGAYQLVAGTGRYAVGGDTIEFGPGHPADPDTPPEYNPGENYKYLGGTNATAGIKVYITGRTRGSWLLTLQGSSTGQYGPHPHIV
jgi:hypothetical protein